MKIITRAAALVFLTSTTLLAQQFASVPGQGRSMVVTKFGIVAAPQFLASQAGAHILEEGGNAIDAAIAANAVMGVVQPYVNGMGGDLFALYYDAKTGKLYGLNSSGWTPTALTIDYLKSHHIERIDPIGVHSIDIPRCCRWLASIERSLRYDAVQQNAGTGDLLCTERISASGAQCTLLG